MISECPELYKHSQLTFEIYKFNSGLLQDGPWLLYADSFKLYGALGMISISLDF